MHVRSFFRIGELMRTQTFLRIRLREQLTLLQVYLKVRI